MARRRKTQGADEFARIPISAMESDALKTAPHVCYRILAILLVGNPKERNGTLAASDAYAARFGLTSKNTRQRTMDELLQRGLIVCTRPGMKLRRWPTLWAVTWWPTFYRDGAPLKVPEPASHAYLKYTPPVRVKRKVGEKKIHPDSEGDVTPMDGVKEVQLHPHLAPKQGDLHPHHGGNSRSRSGSGRALSAESPSAHPPSPEHFSESVRIGGSLADDRIRKVRKHLTVDPAAANDKLRSMYGASDADIQIARSHA